MKRFNLTGNNAKKKRCNQHILQNIWISIMNILLAGASGMIGKALIKRLGDTHQWFLLGRCKDKLSTQFPQHHCVSYAELDDFKQEIDVVIHLSGQNIADFLWTKAYRQKILDSRVQTALKLCQWINQQHHSIRVLAANAIGFYGCYMQASPEFSEDMHIEPNPDCFSQHITHQWQAAWQALQEPKQLTIMRFGVVLQKNQGMLKRLTPSFKLGAGAILGSGKQMISWIDIDDLCDAIMFLMEQAGVEGEFNLVAPHPVSQADFAKQLAQTFKRGLHLRLPAWLIKGMMGQMGQELLLSGQAVLPKRLSELGFHFNYPSLQQSLSKAYG